MRSLRSSVFQQKSTRVVNSALPLLWGYGLLVMIVACSGDRAAEDDIQHISQKQTLSDGLVGWWKFDEAAGATTLADAAGAADNGTLVNSNAGSGFVPGKVGNAYRFAKQPYFRVEDSADLDSVTHQLTIATWIKYDGTGSVRAIFGRPVAGSDAEYFYLYTQDNGRIRFQNGSSSSGQLVTAGNTLPVGQWAHVAVTWNTATTMVRIYVNGTEVANKGNFTPGTPLSQNANATSWAAIGCNINSDVSTGANNCLSGDLDQLMLYNRALSVSEIQALAQGELPPPPAPPPPDPPPPGPPSSGLVGWWKFDEAAGATVAMDSAGAPDNGTLVASNAESGFVPGKVGNAYHFAKQPYFRIEDSAELDSVTDQLTIATWIKYDGTGSIRTIFGRPVAGSDAEYYYFYTQHDGRLRFQNGESPSGHLITAGNILPIGQWAHVAVTWNTATTTAKIYVNGTEVASKGNFTPETPLSQNANATSWAVIGCNINSDASTGSVNCLSSTLDNLMLYNRALSASEIQSLAQGELPPPPEPPAPEPPNPPSEGLVAWWRFDEAAGATVAADSAGTPDNGTLVAGNAESGFVPGKFGNAYHFAKQPYFRVNDSAELDSITEQLTIATWVKPTGQDSIRAIFGRPVAGSNAEYYYFYIQHNGRLRFQNGQAASGQLITESDILPNNQWSHVAVTWDTTNTTAKIYVNGVEVARKANFTPTTPLSQNASATSWAAIGCNINSDVSTGTVNCLSGDLDHLLLYNRALSAAEVQVLAAGTLGTAVTPQVTCVIHDTTGGFMAVFGHENQSDKNVNLPAGLWNTVSPGSVFQDQPEWFSPGISPAAFTVDSPTGAPVEWVLDGKIATATLVAPACDVDESHPDGLGIIVDGQSYVIEYLPEKILENTIGSAAVTVTGVPSAGTIGTTPGQLMVTDSGSASYTLPIHVPSGRRGMQPSLALVYNSNNSNGHLGVGFTLSGLSSIARCTRNLREDGEVAPIRMAATDALCLDGAKLVEVESPPPRPSHVSPGNSGEYRTLRDNLTRIFRYDNAAGQPSQFQVFTREGRIMIYANPSGGPSVPLWWHLVQVRDLFGNTIDYHYVHKGSHETLVDTISYTGRIGDLQSAKRQVKFHWVGRGGDSFHGYRAGQAISRTQVLSQIDLLAPNPIDVGRVRSYMIGYGSSPATSRLRIASVKECVWEGEDVSVCKAPTTFDWENGETGFTRHETAIDPHYPAPPGLDEEFNREVATAIAVGDINGDGFDDFLFTTGSISETSELNVWVAYNSGTPVFFDVASRSDFDSRDNVVPQVIDLDRDGKAEIIAKVSSRDFVRLGMPAVPQGWQTGYVFAQVADVTGDGLPEVISNTLNISWNPGGAARVETEYRNIYGPEQRDIVATPTYKRTEADGIFVLDLDGDGKNEILSTYVLSSYRAHHTSPAGGQVVHDVLPSHHVVSAYRIGDGILEDRLVAMPYSPIDINNDGLVDLVNENGVNYLNKGDGTFQTAHRTPAVPSLLGHGFGARHASADLDGDGNQDLVIFGAPDGTRVYFNRGGSYQHTPLVLGAAAHANRGRAYHFRDLCSWPGPDGLLRYCEYDPINEEWKADGKSAEGCNPYRTVCSRPMWHEINNCSIIYNDEHCSGAYCSCKSDNRERDYHLNPPIAFATARTLDVNGDGLSDILQVEGNKVVVYVKNGKKPDLLRVVTDGRQMKNEVSYAPMNSSVHQRAETCSYPYDCMNRNRWVAQEIKWDLGIENANGTPRGTVMRELYTYTDGRSDIITGQFLGFREIDTVQENIDGSDVETVLTRNRKFARTHEIVTTSADSVGQFVFSGIETSSTTTVMGIIERSYVRQSEILPELLSAPGRDPLEVQYGLPGTPPGTNQRIFRTFVQGTSLLHYETHSPFPPPPKILGTAHLTRHERLFDEYGNVTFDRSRVYRDETVSTYSLFSETTLVSNFEPAGRFLGLPAEKVVHARIWREASGPGITALPRTIGFINDYGKGVITSEIIQPGGGPDMELTTTFVRNADGLVSEVHATDVQGNKRSSSTVFDPVEGMYPFKLRNAAGHVVREMYHPAIDTIVWSQDENGIVTKHQYDLFGRPHAVIGPQQTGMTITRVGLGTAHILTTTNVAGGTTRTVTEDRAGRVVRHGTSRLNSLTANSQTVYDRRGRVERIVSPVDVVKYSYDVIDRVIMQQVLDRQDQNTVLATETTTHHGPYRTEFTDAVNNYSEVLKDVFGQVVEKIEWLADGNPPVVTTYRYLPHGLVDQITMAGGERNMTYDTLGRRELLVDPDSGITMTTHNAFGDVRHEIDGRWVETLYDLDGLGRVVKKTNVVPGVTTNEVTTFEWDTAPHGIGKLAGMRSPDGVQNAYSYESNYGDLSRVKQSMDGKTYEVERSYDEFARLDTLTYPQTPGWPRLALKYEYANTNGRLKQVERLDNASTLWTLHQTDAADRPLLEELGNQLQTQSQYEPRRGFLESLHVIHGTDSILDLEYRYRANGMVRSRQINSAEVGSIEGFEYDALNRLVRWHQSDSLTGTADPSGWWVEYAYTTSGNMTRRRAHAPGHPVQEVEQVYGTGGTWSGSVTGSTLWPNPNAGQPGEPDLLPFDYDFAGNVTKHPKLGTITYTAFNLPRTVGGLSGDVPSAEYRYDAMGTRARKRTSAAGGTTTTYVEGLYEERVEGSGAPVHVLYVGGMAQVLRRGSGETADEQTRYFHKDRLGSVTMTTDETGEVDYIIHLDPYGNRVKDLGTLSLDPRISGSLPTPGPTLSSVTVGYTGHEQEDDLGVINMGGRIYDAHVGRFLQADPFVQAPYFSQSLNRYIYAWNNPMNATDPSGLCVDITPSGGQDATNGESTLSPLCMDHYNAATGMWGGTTTDLLDKFAAGQLFHDAFEALLRYDFGEPLVYQVSAHGQTQEFARMAEAMQYKAHLERDRQTGNVTGKWLSVTLEMGDTVWREKYYSISEPGLESSLIQADDLSPKGALKFAGALGITKLAGREAAEQLSITAGKQAAAGILSHAGKHGIQPYNQLTKALKGTGLQAHHLIEQRFAGTLGQNVRQMASVAVTPVEHQVFTNAWRALIPYGEAGTGAATRESIMQAARQVYANHPAILRALGL